MLGNLYERYGRKKVYIAAALVLIIINILSMVITHQIKISFSIQGQLFKYVSKTNNVILFTDSEDNEVTVTIDELSTHSYVPFRIAGRYQIEYKDKVIKCDSTDWMNSDDWADKGEVMTLSDGTKYTHPFISINNGNDNTFELPFDVQLVEQINRVNEYIKTGSQSWVLIFTIPMILLGLQGFVYPDKVWRVQYMWTVSGGEPTDFALFANKIGGVFIIIVSLVLSVIAA